MAGSKISTTIKNYVFYRQKRQGIFGPTRHVGRNYREKERNNGPGKKYFEVRKKIWPNFGALKP
jgi:hypothetical protein